MIKFSLHYIILLLFVNFIITAAEEAPSGGIPLLDSPISAIGKRDCQNGRIEVVTLPNGPVSGPYLRISCDKNGSVWDVSADVQIQQAIVKGELFLLDYWARTVSTSHESQQGLLTLKVEGRESPWDLICGRDITLPKEWIHIWIRGRASADLAAGNATLRLFAGVSKQVIEIAGLRIQKYGTGMDFEKLPSTRVNYIGRAAGAPWRKAADDRIKKYRMAPLRVIVLGQDAKPIRDAEISIEQVKSSFQFGINMPVDQIVSKDNPSDETYRRMLPQLFNSTVFPNDLKWESWSGEWGSMTERLPRITAALQWARQQGLFIRGHVMIWPGDQGSWSGLPKYMRDFKDAKPDPAAIQQLIFAHIDEVAEATAGYIDEWDVVNEPRDRHALIDLIGPESLASWYIRARQRLPNVKLAINEYSLLTEMNAISPTHDLHEAYIRKILVNGGPLDTICMEGYFGMMVPTPERMLQTIDRFSALGPHVRVSEYSMRCDDEDMKCDFTRDLITVLYSHPKVDGFTTWMGMDAFVKADGSLTAMGRMYTDLVLKKFRTNAVLRTAPDGTCSVSGHLGRYKITVKRKEGDIVRWLTLKSNGDSTKQRDLQYCPDLIITVP